VWFPCVCRRQFAGADIPGIGGGVSVTFCSAILPSGPGSRIWAMAARGRAEGLYWACESVARRLTYAAPACFDA